ncbi:MAG: hypothetical protein QXX20_03060 [Candidatus Thermoplasmatota archaeon]
MKKITNSQILRKILLLLITIAGRRSSETIACAFMEAIVLSLKEKYDFLHNITIHNITYHEGALEGAIEINPIIEKIPPNKIGESIESIIRILCMDLEEDTGLYFIHELKTRLENEYLVELKNIGVDLDLLRLEQKHLHEQLERKKMILHHQEENQNAEMKVTIPNYAWTDVATFKYRNNICFLYNKKGQLLDRLHINKLMEYYVRTLTDFGKLTLKKEKIEVTEKQHKLLEMIYERDIDEETALYFLQATKAEFNDILNQLLRYEYLQYTSTDEIKLTEKGIMYLQEKKAQPENTVDVPS